MLIQELIYWPDVNVMSMLMLLQQAVYAYCSAQAVSVVHWKRRGRSVDQAKVTSLNDDLSWNSSRCRGSLDIAPVNHHPAVQQEDQCPN